ncbi:MAG: hypothetical protein HC880_13710 [Bacteroidia bacterium]|nr:hypothetical protein [Bacteroidia bacterium]
MRYLLGDEVADILALPPANWTQSLVHTMALGNRWQSWLRTSSQSARADCKSKSGAIWQRRILVCGFRWGWGDEGEGEGSSGLIAEHYVT